MLGHDGVKSEQMRLYKCFSNCFGGNEKNMSSGIDHQLVERLQHLPGLSWISDAPLFIDRDLVERFFDAVVRPTYETESLSEGSQTEFSGKLKAVAEATATGKLAGPSWIPSWLFPVKAEATVKGGVEAEGQIGRTNSRVTQLKPIWNAERQLEDLTRHYFQFHPGRMIVNDRLLDNEEASDSWSLFSVDEQFFTEAPRALAFIDLPPRSKIVPTAAEFEDGTVALIYEDLVKRLTNEHGGPMRKYPSDAKDKDGRKAYWASFDKERSPFSSRDAMVAIEVASKAHGRIRWIDFRVLYNSEGDTIHLHVVSSLKADAGVFGYNFVRRAHAHGVRLVGSLKSGPDLNVMAIYDK